MVEPKRQESKQTTLAGTIPAPECFCSMLAVIFFAELATLIFAFTKCTDGTMTGREAEQTIKERCPDIGGRSEQLFGVAVATTLSLLGAGSSTRE